MHLIRNTFRLTSKYCDEIKRDVKPIYTAVNAAARSAFDELSDKWGQHDPLPFRPVTQD